MRTAVNQQYGSIESIEIIATTIPKIGEGEVLVKVNSAGLNPKDILIRKGKFKQLTGSKFPQGIGFDFSGIIAESKSRKFAKGDEVYGMINGWKGRTCAEYVNVKDKELGKKPDNISFEGAAGIPLAGQTALQAIRDMGDLAQGQTILINGASGGVGTLAIQIAKELGGVVTTITSTKSLGFCKSLGADAALSYQDISIADLNEKYDVFFDVFGNYSFKKVSNILTSHGRYITTVPKPAIFKEQFFNLFRKKKAKLVYVKSNDQDLEWISEKIKEEGIKPVVDKVFSLEEIRTAQTYIESKRAKGKVILNIRRAIEDDSYA